MDSSRFTGLRLATLASALFVVGTNAFVIAGVLPDIAAAFDVTTTTVGYSITAYAILVAVFAPIFSMVLAHVRPELVMAAGMLVFAAGTGLSVLAPEFVGFFLSRALAGLGGAALVPLATATAPRLARPGRQGQAIAVVGLGFTLAVALGAPLGTALSEVSGWRWAIGLLAVIGAALGVGILFLLRGVPTNPKVTLRERVGVLLDARAVLAIAAILLMILAFNLIYIFASTVTHGVTGGDGTLLAILLLVFGLAGAAGTMLGGWLTDARSNLFTLRLLLIVEAAALALLLLSAHSLIGTAMIFALWGVSCFGATVAVQHRLASIRPSHSGILLSWYSTGMYVGISLAPVIGAAALGVAGRTGLVVAACAAALLALATTVPVRGPGSEPGAGPDEPAS